MLFTFSLWNGENEIVRAQRTIAVIDQNKLMMFREKDSFAWKVKNTVKC